MAKGNSPTQSNGRTQPTFHLGVGAWAIGHRRTAEDYAAQGALAEELGFHSYWLPENHFGDHTTLPAPLMVLAAVAARTHRLGLGTGSYLLPIRHPLAAAEEVAVLDCLSRGRVTLGIGRGYQGAMFRAFDVPVKEKRSRFEETLDVMIRAWSGEPIPVPPPASKPGAPMESVTLSPLPVQRPHPPLWVAAFGPKALTQAGGLGLPYIASPVETMEVLGANLTHYWNALDAAERPRHQTVPVMRTTFVCDNPARVRQVKAALMEAARALAKTATSAMRRAGESPVEDWALVGEPNEISERIAKYREELGVTHLIATRTRLRDVKTAEMLRSIEHLAKVTQSL